MKTKEQHYESVLVNRKLMEDPEFTKCPCPNVLCDWNGKCTECVAVHRHYKDHIPMCLIDVFSDKLEALARLLEKTTVDIEPVPFEHRKYVKEQDALAEKGE